MCDPLINPIPMQMNQLDSKVSYLLHRLNMLEEEVRLMGAPVENTPTKSQIRGWDTRLEAVLRSEIHEISRHCEFTPTQIMRAMRGCQYRVRDFLRS